MKYLIGLDYADVLVVMMYRHIPDIIRSETKSKVDFNAVNAGTKRSYYAEDLDVHAAELKYLCWEEHCSYLPHAMEVGYESLKDHPLWLQDRDHLTFEHTIRQPPLPKVFRDGLLALQNI